MTIAAILLEGQKSEPSASGDASAELAVNTGSLLDSQRDLLVDGLRTAGLPLCATEDDLAGIAQPVRLPECKTERIKRAATRS
jgi:hypothetical protein